MLALHLSQYACTAPEPLHLSLCVCPASEPVCLPAPKPQHPSLFACSAPELVCLPAPEPLHPSLCACIAPEPVPCAVSAPISNGEGLFITALPTQWKSHKVCQFANLLKLLTGYMHAFLSISTHVLFSRCMSWLAPHPYCACKPPNQVAGPCRSCCCSKETPRCSQPPRAWHNGTPRRSSTPSVAQRPSQALVCFVCKRSL